MRRLIAKTHGRLRQIQPWELRLMVYLVVIMVASAIAMSAALLFRWCIMGAVGAFLIGRVVFRRGFIGSIIVIALALVATLVLALLGTRFYAPAGPLLGVVWALRRVGTRAAFARPRSSAPSPPPPQEASQQ
jgi:hypothetical protein